MDGYGAIALIPQPLIVHQDDFAKVFALIHHFVSAAQLRHRQYGIHARREFSTGKQGQRVLAKIGHRLRHKGGAS